MKPYIRVLTIAGSDSGGGAGIQADLKTFSALGCYGMSVITALTAQNTLGVQSIYPVAEKFVGDQLDSVLSDIGVDAVKIGMLADSQIIQMVANRLSQFGVKKVVLDPVMFAKSGDALLKPEALLSLKRKLLPLSTVMTPNIPEAEKLLHRKFSSKSAIEEAAKDLSAFGPSAVLIKGGHGGRETSDDCLYLSQEEECIWFSSPRLSTKNTHGTGCTLSSAIAAFYAQGFDIRESVRRGKEYLFRCLEAGSKYVLGNGRGPVNHWAGRFVLA